jgi:hypothetical protein
MGLTNNLGKLSNIITSTGSAVGIAQPSPANTLDVTGTFRATGTTTLGGQIVSSNGSIVLQTTASNTVSTGNYIGFGAGGGTTSNNVIQGGVGQFLIFGYTGSAWITPLTISNSTGAATFSSSITATDGTFSGSGVDGSLGSVVRISTTNTNGNARNWALVNTFDSYGDLNFRLSTAQGGNALTAGTTVLTLSRTGAATLNGPLQVTTTSNNGITITTNDITTLKMNSSGGSTKNWGFATTNLAASDFGIYQSTSNGGDPISAGTAKLYFTGGGNVLIGTTTDNAYKLNVNGSIYSSNAITSASNSGNSTRSQYGKAIPASSSVTFTFTAGGGNILGFNIIIGGYGGALTGWLGGTICGGGYMGYNSTIYNVVNNVTTSGALTVSISKSANSFAVIITNSAAATGSVYLTLDTTGDGLTIS